MVYHHMCRYSKPKCQLKDSMKWRKRQNKCSLLLPCALVCIRIRLITLLIVVVVDLFLLCVSNFVKLVAESESAILLSSDIIFNFLQQYSTEKRHIIIRKENQMLKCFLCSSHTRTYTHAHTHKEIH